MRNKTIAIIPARAGSKRIPKKNIKLFLGKPIIAYSIQAAISSNLFDEVMVSTDSQEIADIALSYGAKVPFFRSEKASDDYATTFDVVEEVLNEYKKQGRDFEFACCVYACAPLIQASKLVKAFEILQKEKYDSVIPVTLFSFPIQRALKIENQRLAFVNPDEALTRSQDLEKTYHDPGQFYFMNCENILNKKSILTNNTGTILIDEIRTQDIDSQSDWDLAELKYKLNFKNDKL